MADTGWLSPTSAAESGTEWSNETNIFSSNDVYATRTSTATGTTPTLWAYGFNFSGVPTGATIDGIEISVEDKCSSNTLVQRTKVQLYDGTTAMGTNQESGTTITQTEGVTYFGGATNLCGWTAIADTDLDSTFRVGVEYTQSTTSNRIISVDHIQVKIYYTEASGSTQWGTATFNLAMTNSVSGTVTSGSSTELNRQVGASSDDARETNAGTMQLTETTMLVGQNNHAAFRFTNITIPKDATINQAYVSVKSATTDSTTTTYSIYIEDIDDATTFTSTTYDISGRTWTAGPSNQTSPDGVTGQWFNSADFSSMLETHLSRSGWVSGNDINVQFVVSAGGRTIYTYDNAAADAPKIYINYTASGTSGGNKTFLKLSPF